MGRRGRIAAVFVALLSLGVAVVFASRLRPREQPPFEPLSEVVRNETAGGWQLSEDPNLAGPYRRFAVPYQLIKGTGGGARWYNGVDVLRHTFSVRPDADQLAIPLETADGRLTVAVLVLPTTSSEPPKP